MNIFFTTLAMMAIVNAAASDPIWKEGETRAAANVRRLQLEEMDPAGRFTKIDRHGGRRGETGGEGKKGGDDDDDEGKKGDDDDGGKKGGKKGEFDPCIIDGKKGGKGKKGEGDDDDGGGKKGEGKKGEGEDDDDVSAWRRYC